MRSKFALLALLTTLGTAHAQCPAPQFTDSFHVELNSDTLVLATHASTYWDGMKNAKQGVDETVAFAKSHQIPVVYLQDDSEGYYWGDCNPTYTVRSAAGEFYFHVPARHVYTIGGHWDACELTSIEDLTRQWKQARLNENLTITYVMNGLYMYGADVTDKDTYYNRWNKELIQLDQKNPEHFNTKMNLVQMIEIINRFEKRGSHALKTEFFKEQLPPSVLSFSENYQIELWYEGERIEIIRPATVESDTTPPVLKLEYIHSITNSVNN